MDARKKLQGLSHSWYGYTVFSTLVSILGLRASGIFTLMVGLAMWAILNAIGLVISLALVTWVSRSLLNRSALMRRFMVLVSGLGTLFGALGVFSLVGAFFHFWSLGILVQLALCISWMFLNVRSFMTLTQTSVKAYFV